MTRGRSTSLHTRVCQERHRPPQRARSRSVCGTYGRRVVRERRYLRHHRAVETEKRDEKTVVIGAALGLFALVLAAGTIILWLADVTLDRSGSLVGTTQVPLVAVAGLVMVGFLARHRRR